MRKRLLAMPAQVSYKHGRHVKVVCLLKLGQVVRVDREYGMGRVNGIRRKNV